MRSGMENQGGRGASLEEKYIVYFIFQKLKKFDKFFGLVIFRWWILVYLVYVVPLKFPKIKKRRA